MEAAGQTLTDTKRCSTCKQEKARSEFNRNRARKDGLQHQCRSCDRAHSAKWHEENTERKRAYAKKWTEENAERHRANFRKWAKANPDRAAAKTALTKARQRGARLPDWTSSEIIDDTMGHYAHARALTAKTGVQYHVDHIVPIALGGHHVSCNLRVITATENQQKHTKVTDEVIALYLNGCIKLEDYAEGTDVWSIITDYLEAKELEHDNT